MYYAIGVSVSSLHRESTDSPIYLVCLQVSVTAPSVSVSTADIAAGDTVYLTCDYALRQSVDATVSVMWMVNGSAIDTSKDGNVPAMETSSLL